MSGFNSHGVGACANADVVSAVSAAAIKRVLVENPVILPSPIDRSEKVGHIVEQITNVILPSTCRFAASPSIRLCDFPPSASRLSSGFG
jgi:hypothetical protein